MKKISKTNKPGIIYSLFKTYLRFIHDKLYYRHTYRLNHQIIPADGTPLMIVSNHQNCLNDPLGILFTFRDRKPNFITRADVFSIHPLANKFLRSIGLLPAFRINFEGEEALSNNRETFLITEHALINGRTIIIYPEAGHQDKHWLGDFSFGYTRLAFEAAELDNFKTDIFILPSCNHYADYYHIQEQFLVKFGTPISLQPYYELYKTKPRTAQRQINTLVREQIIDLMLHIEDLDNYRAIDFLRNTYGKKYALKHHLDPGKLPDRLVSDKAFVAGLEKLKAREESAVTDIYRQALVLEQGIRELHINDGLFDKTPSGIRIAAELFTYLILFPLWLFSLWPNALNFVIPKLLIDRIDDKLFYGTFLYAFSVLFSIPLLYTFTFMLAYIYMNFWIALIYLALLPLLGLFAWYYRKFFIQTWQALHFRKNINTTRLNQLKDLRTDIHNKLDIFLQEVK
ncbi:MAG: 1-acyl-sn-glycerol-3-phosphate acyltransferase [Tannerella sp.]|jgi:1-acyl-sn-glycerol-3-phosphate acyltransferase|nr:1-acyl-sn-glycerol-3-phosphate acyltransferase [Tannerella sp.]